MGRSMGGPRGAAGRRAARHRRSGQGRLRVRVRVTEPRGADDAASAGDAAAPRGRRWRPRRATAMRTIRPAIAARADRRCHPAIALRRLRRRRRRRQPVDGRQRRRRRARRRRRRRRHRRPGAGGADGRRDGRRGRWRRRRRSTTPGSSGPGRSTSRSATSPSPWRAARDGIRAMGGYIGASTTQNEGDTPIATVTYRIPADRWEDALDLLRGLNGPTTKVVTERTEAVEVTGPGHRPRGAHPQPAGERGRPPGDRRRGDPDLRRPRGPDPADPGPRTDRAADRAARRPRGSGGLRDADRVVPRPDRRGRGRPAGLGPGGRRRRGVGQPDRRPPGPDDGGHLVRHRVAAACSSWSGSSWRFVVFIVRRLRRVEPPVTPRPGYARGGCRRRLTRHSLPFAHPVGGPAREAGASRVHVSVRPSGGRPSTGSGASRVHVSVRPSGGRPAGPRRVAARRAPSWHHPRP